jgi:hypothetical protein
MSMADPSTRIGYGKDHRMAFLSQTCACDFVFSVFVLIDFSSGLISTGETD